MPDIFNSGDDIVRNFDEWNDFPINKSIQLVTHSYDPRYSSDPPSDEPSDETTTDQMTTTDPATTTDQTTTDDAAIPNDRIQVDQTTLDYLKNDIQ